MYPQLVAEWHPEKNLDLTPYHVSPGSMRKIWWKCVRGHEWQATVADRTKARSRCPFCAGRRPWAENNLAVRHPELALEWHPTKNGSLTPRDVLPGSSIKVWWRCARGHEWQANLGNRFRGTHCPFCSGLLATSERNLALLAPEVSRQWHPSKNQGLTPKDVLPTSKKKAWWICNLGHEFERSISAHVSDNGQCPVCRQAKNERNTLAVRYPLVAAKWHPKKNGSLTPADVPPKSGKKVWWKCARGHEWQRTIAQATTGGDCPYCYPLGERAHGKYNLEFMFPDLASQWHPSKNGDLTPADVRPYIGKSVWWICQNGHEWEAPISSRSLGSGCPDCIRERLYARSLAAMRPDIAGQWHPSKNAGLKPSDVTILSSKKVWWICGECGNEWSASVHKRVCGSECPACVEKARYRGIGPRLESDERAIQWHPDKNGTLKPSDLSISSKKMVWWKCSRGHEWQAPFVNRKKGIGCPYCAGNKADWENNLLVVYPGLASQWNWRKNGDLIPSNVTPHSGKHVWWICEHGHEWKAQICNRARGQGCPICYRNGISSNERLPRYLVKEWHPSKNGDLTPDQVWTNSCKTVWWKCARGHEWKSKICNRVKGTACPSCMGRKPLPSQL